MLTCNILIFDFSLPHEKYFSNILCLHFSLFLIACYSLVISSSSVSLQLKLCAPFSIEKSNIQVFNFIGYLKEYSRKILVHWGGARHLANPGNKIFPGDIAITIYLQYYPSFQVIFLTEKTAFSRISTLF